MKLPTNCPHRRSAKNWCSARSGDGDLDQPACCRTTDRDIMRAYLPKRGPLCENAEHRVEEYRFTWRSLYRHDDAVVQISSGKNITLDWGRNRFGANGRCWRCIQEPDWKRLEEAVLAAGFWALDAESDSFGATVRRG